MASEATILSIELWAQEKGERTDSRFIGKQKKTKTKPARGLKLWTAVIKVLRITAFSEPAKKAEHTKLRTSAVAKAMAGQAKELRSTRWRLRTLS